MILRDNVEERINKEVILELDVSSVLTSDCVNEIIPVFITLKRSLMKRIGDKNNDK
jgi:hypothetical protein